MTGFDDRQSAFENKFALDENNLFKAEARACKQLGLWLAEKIGLTDEEATSYAGAVIGANLEEPGFDDVLSHVMPDVEKHDLNITAEEMLEKVTLLYVEAQKAIKEGEAA